MSGRGYGTRGGRGGGGYRGGGGGRGRGGGGYNTRGGGRGRGNFRGGRGSRGGGRGRGRGRGGGGAGRVIQKWKDSTHANLLNEVDQFNRNTPGPERTMVRLFKETNWEAKWSLSYGRWYYTDKSQDGVRAQPFKRPAELAEDHPYEETWMDHPMTFPTRPTWDPTRMRRTQVITNSYEVTGSLLNTPIFEWAVTFTPDIPVGRRKDRENVIRGTRFHERQRNRDLLTKAFTHCEFDNIVMYSQSPSPDMVPSHGDEITFETGELNQAYRVSFKFTGVKKMTDDEMEVSRQEQLLNIFLRDGMRVAGYRKRRDGGKKTAWYSENGKFLDHCQIVQGRGQAGDLAILMGFEGNFRASSNEHVVFKTNIATRLLWKSTLHAQLEALIGQCRSDDEFKSKAEKEFKGKYFILEYSKRSYPIAEIDWGQTERSSMGEDNTMTFCDYYRSKYGIRSNLKERCVVKTRDGNCYLPQHCRLTVVSDKCKDMYDEAMSRINLPIHQRLAKLDAFVAELNQKRVAATKGGRQPVDNGPGGVPADYKWQLNYHIAARGKSVPALVLDTPQIILQTRNGPTTFSTSDLPGCWGRNTFGYLDDLKQISRWCVVYDRRSMPGLEENFKNAFNAYCRKRGFDPNRGRGPFAAPKFRACDLSNTAQYPKHVHGSDCPELLVVALPDQIEGSEIKVRFTKAVQLKSGKPVQLQFFKWNNVHKNTIMFGVFEDIAIKMGNVLYKIDPGMRPDSAILKDKVWSLGIDVSHNGARSPSVATMTIMRSPFVGSQRDIDHVCHYNPPRQELIGYNEASSMMTKILKTSWDRIGRDPDKLPKQIIVYRDGVADGQLREMNSKEVTGIKRAIYEFFVTNKKMKSLLKKKHGKSWRPKLTFVVSQKQIMDHFGQLHDNGRVSPPREACVIFDYIMSHRVWDFLGWFNPRGKNRPVRYIVVHDGNKLGAQQESAIDLFQFTYGLTYSYACAVPFPLGNQNQPAPVKYAKHYSQHQSQCILSNDANLRSVNLTNQSLNRPQLLMAHEDYLRPMGNQTNQTNRGTNMGPVNPQQHLEGPDTSGRNPTPQQPRQQTTAQEPRAPPPTAQQPRTQQPRAQQHQLVAQPPTHAQPTHAHPAQPARQSAPRQNGGPPGYGGEAPPQRAARPQLPAQPQHAAQARVQQNGNQNGWGDSPQHKQQPQRAAQPSYQQNPRGPAQGSWGPRQGGRAAPQRGGEGRGGWAQPSGRGHPQQCGHPQGHPQQGAYGGHPQQGGYAQQSYGGHPQGGHPSQQHYPPFSGNPPGGYQQRGPPHDRQAYDTGKDQQCGGRNYEHGGHPQNQGRGGYQQRGGYQRGGYQE